MITYLGVEQIISTRSDMSSYKNSIKFMKHFKKF